MQWRASHILVKDKALAQSLLNRLKTGASFTSLAKEHSICPSRSKGGDLGWFGPGKMVPAFEKAVASLRMHGVSSLVHTSFGYHIIQKTGEQ